MTMVSSKLTDEHVFTGGIEGPACDREGNLYAVNYAKQGTIGRIAPDGTGELWLELPEGSTGNGIRFNREGDMFIADYTGHNILRVNMKTKEVSVWAHEPRMNQPNDIAIMRDGTIFASDPNWADGTGNLWCIHPPGTVTLLEQNMGTTNGVEVGPREDVLYVNESAQRTIWAYDLDADKRISNKRLLIAFDDYSLDGMRCDMDGNLYVTRHGKGVVAKISPQGEVLHEIQLEGTDCTNVCFGGPDGKQCYVTVADRGGVQTFRVERPGRCWGMWMDQ
ncbi:SMP-30/gluconolactonase/LRE family protein [Paenibacillus spongiae]|uniref:SMP-30/gluconolactonase/LRE family protein n=1 Tax=Paenibacillus spongiae TaxID=2909671 RepID=A0ABY5SCQ9_9BACL|nr:SMP-30/gluconolactonase/LRE family protein [Paenibacillus spongiae]UVI31564.1 SMP-30/gluconolactonase/LRE family protein [Paenibacillus spongiae]